jgi:hypothetical protein
VAPLTPKARLFWADLYRELQQIDAELADEVTASIMY